MAWASEFGASVVVSTDWTARQVLPKEIRDRPGVLDLLANRASPSDCAYPLPDSRALIIGPGTQQHVMSELSSHRFMPLWSRLDHVFGKVLVSAIHPQSTVSSMAIRTAGRVVGIVRDNQQHDEDLQELLDALDKLSAADRLVGVILVDDDGDIGRSTSSGPEVVERLDREDAAPVEFGDSAAFQSDPHEPRSAKLRSRT
jgi:hypothetical protein